MKIKKFYTYNILPLKLNSYNLVKVFFLENINLIYDVKVPILKNNYDTLT